MKFSKMSDEALFELEIYLRSCSMMIHTLRGDIINIDACESVSNDIKAALIGIRKELLERRKSEHDG